ncbi:MAG: hypothetical protein ACXVH3_31105 [Solirubrobacteraceae bacterium]
MSIPDRPRPALQQLRSKVLAVEVDDAIRSLKRARGGWLRRVAKEPGAAWTAAALSMLPGPPMAATPGARVGVLRFDQAQADQSPVLIHSLDRVAVQL